MTHNMNDRVKEYKRKRRFRSRWAKLLGAMACVVVFCTTYALILPAITLESTTTCGMAEHTHGEDCYETVLTCDLEETSTAEEQVLICGQEEGSGAHTHTEDCYAQEQVLACGLEESAEHTHTDACYITERILICGEGESQGHVHTEDCYETVAGHVHTEDCYARVLTCELPEHTHTEDCYPKEAQTFTGKAGGVSVTVNAPEGAFPAGTKMSVSQAPETAVQAAAAAVGAEVSDVKAVDITFTSDGQEIEPAAPISVKLEAALVAQAEEAVVVHVDDMNQAQVVEDTTVDGKTVSFQADSFSVYAITDPDGRYTFKFYDSDGVSDTAYETQIIKVGEALVQPPTPDTAENYASFDGWYIGGSYTTDDNGTLIWSGGIKLDFGSALTADRLKELDTAGYRDGTGPEQAGEEDHVIQVWARYSAACEVIFYDHLPVTDPDDPDPGMSQPSIVTIRSAAVNSTLNLSGITAEPRENGEVFAGWVYADGTKVGNSITVTGDTYLYATFAAGYSLVFDANADDATVTATQYVLAGQKPDAPSAPLRTGYTFVGWYTEPDGGQPYTFGQALTENTTVYAHWAASTANYTVVIWRQSIDDDKDAADAQKTYDYETYYTASANTGTTITSTLVASARVTENGSTSTVDCTALDYEGFHYSTKMWDSADEAIAADGSTIINVYYDRDLITMNFTGIGNEYLYTASNSTNQNGMYGLVDGVYVPLTRSGNRGNYTWTYGNNQSYTGQRYTRSSSANYLIMTGLYGQTLAQNEYTWPTTNSTGQRVNWNNGSITTTFMESFMLPDGATTATFEERTAQGYYIYYYLQNTDGTYPDEPTNTLRASSTNSQAYFNIADRYTGFHASGYKIGNNGNLNALEGKMQNSDYYASIPLNQFSDGLYVYYARNTYTITYYNGNYSEDHNVLYGTDISTLKPSAENGGLDPTKVPCPYKGDADHYTLKGWFANQEGTVEFNWNRTMPANNLMVYAVWEPETYTVTFDAAGGTLTDAQGTATDKLEVSVAYKDRVSAPPTSPNLAGHVFLGWTYTYTNEDGEEVEAAWTFDTQITSDVTLTAKYYSSDSMVLRYSVDGDLTQITDGNIYQDGADAIITSEIPSGRFIGWKLANDSDGTIYTAGDTITVNTANDMLDGTTDTVVTLTAVYDELPVTSITFNPNSGHFPAAQNPNDDGNYVIEDLLNNDGVDLDAIMDPIRPGYTFLGWATTDTATKAEFKKDGNGQTEEIFADNTNVPNVLYAVWDPWTTLTIQKVDSADGSTPLADAQFVLSATEGGETYYYSGVNGAPSWNALDAGETEADFALTTNASGSITCTQALSKGTTYTLKEIKAPDGYNLLTENITISVDNNGGITASYGNGSSTIVEVSGTTVTVKNSAGQALPNTGGEGTKMYTTGGLILMAIAMAGGLMYSGRKRRRGGVA